METNSKILCLPKEAYKSIRDRIVDEIISDADFSRSKEYTHYIAFNIGKYYIECGVLLGADFWKDNDGDEPDHWRCDYADGEMEYVMVDTPDYCYQSEEEMPELWAYLKKEIGEACKGLKDTLE